MKSGGKTGADLATDSPNEKNAPMQLSIGAFFYL